MKEIREYFGGRNEETSEGDTWRNWRETRRDIRRDKLRHWKEIRRHIGRRRMDSLGDIAVAILVVIVEVLLEHGEWWQSIKHHSRVNLEGETFEGDMWKHYEDTRGRRHADTLEGDMGRHWKILKGDIGRRQINPFGDIAGAILVVNSGNNIGTW